MGILTDFLYEYIFIAVLYLLCINLAIFALCGIDKKAALCKKRRIKEKTFLLWSFLGGALFMLVGMIVFKHKTHKRLFVVLIPCFLLVHLIIILLMEARYHILTEIIFKKIQISS